MSAPPEPPVFFIDRDLGKQFGNILAVAGLQIERHAQRFAPNSPDVEWLEVVGKNGWVAVTHDQRIRYKPNELTAVVRHRARVIVVVGKPAFAQLAENFVSTAPRIAQFVALHRAPWIAKVYRPSDSELKHNEAAQGTIALWYPRP